MKPSRKSDAMDEVKREILLEMTRRQFFGRTAKGIGVAAVASLLGPSLMAEDKSSGGLPGMPNFAPKAKRVIFLHQSGAPSQIELFDYNPKLKDLQGTELPDPIRKGQRITGMTSGQASFPVAAPIFKFQQYGQSGAWISELLPHTAKIVDDIAIIKTVNTDAINHDPAITFIQTGFQQPGRPSMGAWVTYGLGSENQNRPAFVVLISQANALNPDQPLFSRLWGNGFLSSKYQGVRFRAGAEPVLYLDDPPGISSESRRHMLDSLAQLNKMWFDAYGDPEIETRITQYEMAYRMQTSVPDLMDLSKEPDSVFDMYGPDSRKPGTFAANCLLARRLAEKGVKFIQLYHQGWDQHGTLPKDIQVQCRKTDQASAALVTDLKQRGLLDDTLVVWGGEFGRTAYSQGKLTATDYGRDHHPRCFSVWMAGGGSNPGAVHGETDDFSYNIVKDGVHVHDFHATMLKLLGVDHERLNYFFQGRRFRLTDVYGKVVEPLIA